MGTTLSNGVTYVEILGGHPELGIKVYKDNRFIGTIQPAEDGFWEMTRGWRTIYDTYPTIEALKQELEKE